MTIRQWLYLEELGSDQCVLPIYAAWNQAVTENRVAERTDAITEAGLHITTRLNLVRRIGHRLGKNLAALMNNIAEHITEDHLCTLEHEGIAVRVDNELKYLVIADLHSVVSEFDACIDSMKDFMHALHDHVKRPLTVKQRIRMINSWMHEKGIDPSWFKKLAGCRNFVAHEGAFYLAIDTTERQWDLLMVKKNVKKFDDPKTYVRFSSVEEIMTGFMACRAELQAHLVTLLTDAA